MDGTVPIKPDMGLLYTESQTGKLRVRRYVVRVATGPDAGLRSVLDEGSLVIGTSDDSDLILTDPTISRRHLEVTLVPPGVRLNDLDSTNGSYLGATRLGNVTTPGPARVRVGSTELEIAPEDAAVSVASYPSEEFGRAFGTSMAMRELFGLLDRVAATDSTVLLLGETGTGKELLAEGVHTRSRRASKPFVVVDCAAMPPTLMASELFGHARGAFTGADQARQGLCEAADGGTLFLDELGELPLELQPQLLRVLERHEVRRLGETQPRRVNLRIVAATNRDLQAEVRAGRFREDLYFRLAVVRAHVPTLRERPEDIPHLVRRFSRQIGKEMELSDEVIAELKAYEWPGNIRELRNMVEAGLALGSLTPSPGQTRPSGPKRSGVDVGPKEMLEMPFKEAKGQLIDAFERSYLEALLARHQGNISRAAQEAGIDRNYIHRLVRKHNIPVDRSS